MKKDDHEYESSYYLSLTLTAYRTGSLVLFIFHMRVIHLALTFISRLPEL